MNILKRFNTWRRGRHSAHALQQSAHRVDILNQLENAGYLLLDTAHDTLYISNKLAQLYLYEPQRWTGFLNNLQLWFDVRLSNEMMQRTLKDAEARALKEARKKYATLTAAQTQEVIANARLGINTDPVPPSRPFRFVITSTMLWDKEATAIVVGHYHDGRHDMMPWDDVAKEAGIS